MNPSEGAPATALREVSILKLLKHENIVSLISVTYKPGKMILVLELVYRYKPPDVLLGEQNYGPDIDIWSAGCIVYEMMNGKPPFQGSDSASQAKEIFKILGKNTRRLC
ncbi:unnamed protein product [Mesocestoides corti]|uniref:Protein kinase domain-containing protein n=1 Tax=Mesocestoides corti TaxID=53468 RepID=A0A0R3U962_MESCO|nr:unnamed protein product [Mesocestoides corti]